MIVSSSALLGAGQSQLAQANFWLSNVECTGEEASLGMCSHSGWGVHSCGREDAVGLTCYKGLAVNCSANVPSFAQVMQRHTACMDAAAGAADVGAARCRCAATLHWAGTAYADSYVDSQCGILPESVFAQAVAEADAEAQRVEGDIEGCVVDRQPSGAYAVIGQEVAALNFATAVRERLSRFHDQRFRSFEHRACLLIRQAYADVWRSWQFVLETGVFEAEPPVLAAALGTLRDEATANNCGELRFCDAGTYLSAERQPTSPIAVSFCAPCPAGTYGEHPGAVEESQCTSCPEETFSSQPGATSNDACLPCESGTFSAGRAASCTPCPVGTFLDGVGKKSSDCNACPRGYACDAPGPRPGCTLVVFFSPAALTLSARAQIPRQAGRGVNRTGWLRAVPDGAVSALPWPVHVQLLPTRDVHDTSRALGRRRLHPVSGRDVELRLRCA